MLSQTTSPRYKHHGVSSPEWRVLAILCEYGVASSKFLREHSAMSKTRINRTIESLIDSGCIIRQLDSSDKRKNVISLTAKGKTVFKKVGKIAHETQEEWLESFSKDEIATLHQLLDKLEKNIPTL